MSDHIIKNISVGEFIPQTPDQPRPHLSPVFTVIILHRPPTHTDITLIVVLVVQWFGVGLVIERPLVRLPAGALSSQL